jgi:hypothetical protein
MDPVLQWTSALTLALVFGVAAAGKFASWAELEGVVLNYRIAPRWMAPLIARALPPVEALVALGLLVPETRVPSAWVCLTMLVVFAAAMAVNIARGRTDIDCGCFRSSLRQNLSWWLVLRNAIILLELSSQLEFAVIGLVLLVGVTADEVVRRWAERRRNSAAG